MNALSINDNDAAEAEAGETSAGFGGGGGRKKVLCSFGGCAYIGIKYFHIILLIYILQCSV